LEKIPKKEEIMNFVEELKWRGMVHDMTPGTEEQLDKEMTTAYVGIDPTADSLHIGHLVSVMMLKHFQRHGHKPIILVGGATGMIGDPSGKSEERNLLSEEILRRNQDGLKQQLTRFLEFNNKPNSAEVVNNYDWMNPLSFLGFIRDVGKHITVNYMMAKDSVKKRLETGLSFTEFSYQLVQGYDFLFLYENKNCKLQMGGSDQWGNITTGTELIRRKTGGEAFALTCPLITKSDGGKFGKTEQGNIWLNPSYTSPYRFFQFWMNVSDTDAEKYIKIFTVLPIEEITDLINEHQAAPHLRILQKRLAKELTTMVHTEADYQKSIEASEILFGKGTTESLKAMDEDTFLAVFEGVPQYKISLDVIKNEVQLGELLTTFTNIFPSKGEFKRQVTGGGLFINKAKADQIELAVGQSYLINKKYILVQKGKKNYFLIIAD
jgi:tyrosyl-tRNA synthetase